RVQRTDAVEFSEIADKRCLVLLGEPGIGKTFALKRAKRQTSFLLNLGSYGSEERLINDLFRSDEFRNWAKHGGDFEVFIDSFDECCSGWIMSRRFYQSRFGGFPQRTVYLSA